ncbi:NAD-dependent epimerase/dehydratase family protein [Candidatus Latescibacterota bacterium]
MRVLVTGAAGRVGSVVAAGLMGRHQVRGLDRLEMPQLEDTVVGDLTDYDLCVRATRGMEAVIHCGGVPSGGAPWEDILPNNIVGTYNIFEAARQEGVRRIAYASRAGLLGPYPKTQQRTVDMYPRPESYYSVSKVFGESIGYMYSARHDMEVVSVRIGNFKLERPQPEHPHQLSHGDCVRVFETAITRPGVRYEVVFGVSDSDWPLYDLEHGRQVIGYDPQDRSQVPMEDRQ